jgi:phenylalanyl-tRNA synthetase alpha subunit
MNQSDSRAGELARLFDESLSRYQAALAEAKDEPALRVVHARYAGKEGEIRKRLADALKTAPGPDKRAVGQAGNTVLQKTEELFASRLAELHAQKRKPI